ncbi:MAG: cytochrome c-type biogenesis protein [Geminicoccaceae bacterium]
MAILYLFVTVVAAGVTLPHAGVGIVGPVIAATSPDEVMEDPELERRARALAKELRCLVCQNQSIDDSDADLARDLRQLVRERLLAGDSDDEIIAFVTERYGDFVLLRPPVKPSTWGLWYGPPVIFVIAAIGVALYMRRRRHAPVSAPADDLSKEEQARLDRLLGREGSDPT